MIFAKFLLFLVPIHSNPDVDLESQATSFDHYVPPCRLSDSGNGANGFMFLSNENEVDLLSQKFKVKRFLNRSCRNSKTVDFLGQCSVI